jgi:hypothetical protein
MSGVRRHRLSVSRATSAAQSILHPATNVLAKGACLNNLGATGSCPVADIVGLDADH